MIVPDTNLLIFAYNSGYPEHIAARSWWEGLVNGSESVGVPWIVSIGFVRLMSNSEVATSSMLGKEAADYVSDWFRHPHIVPINPGVDHLLHLRRILDAADGGANLVPDAHIAAMAIEYEAEVHTHNARDFSRFPGVRWRNPLR